MKKFLSIFLLFILLFNWIGYRLFTSILETHSSSQLVAAFDNRESDNAEFISLKIPSSLPYYSGTGEFERVTGEIEIENVHYSYVQRKVTHDSIEYLCIVNKAKAAIKKASGEFYKLVNDFQQNTSQKKDSSAKAKMLLAEFDQAGMVDYFMEGDFNKIAVSIYRSFRYKSFQTAPPDLPPNALS